MEKDILFTALENFEKNSTLSIEYSNLDNVEHSDAIVVIESLSNTKYNLEVKKNLTLSNIPFIKKTTNKNNAILVSDYIPKTMKEYLRKEKRSYIDTAGNAYIDKDNIFILIENNKHFRNAFQTNYRAFSKAGLKVIFQLLTENELINKPYRYIGKKSKVSIDTVSKVFKELLREKYIIQLEEKVYKMTNKEKLIGEWVTLYNKTLRSKLKQKKYTIHNKNLNKLATKCPKESLGGELAGEILSNYLIAENAIIYTDLAFIDIMKKLKLIPSVDGNITIVEKFWNTIDTLDKKVIVHPLLIYADLLNNPKPRNLEAANLIYTKYVKAIL